MFGNHFRNKFEQALDINLSLVRSGQTFIDFSEITTVNEYSD
jgi:hypothetical protein